MVLIMWAIPWAYGTYKSNTTTEMVVTIACSFVRFISNNLTVK